MKHIVAIAFYLLLSPVFVFSQGKIGIVKGIITDSLGNKPLVSATINILDKKDSSLVSFGRSKDNGLFEIARLELKEYILLISYTGFAKISKVFSVSAEQPIKDLGNISMVNNASLQDVTVVAAPVSIKGDTVEFNAGSFQVNKPNAVVEDLLKRLPGVEVDKDGNIKANGQDVKRILVDGKEFFGTDPKLATKNLQANMVNKVQVFDKKSDQSQFTGFDDGNTEPTINLTLKNDKRNGIFGRVSGGGGSDGRYQGNTNINRFSKGEQISFIGQANNTNQQGFSLNDALSFSGTGGGRGGGGGFNTGGLNIQGFGSSGQGITATQAAGLNYNNFKKTNLDLTSSYFFNGTQLTNDYTTQRQTGAADSTQLYVEPGKSNRNNYNHRINLGIDWKLDSNNSIKITPVFQYQQTRSNNQKTFATSAGAKGIALSDGLNRTTNENNGFNFSVTALYRHKFLRKGRTFSAELRYGNNQSDAEGTQYTINNRYNTGSAFRSDTLDQRNFTDANATNQAITLRYTEPMSSRSLLEFSTFYSQNDSKRNQRTFDINKLTGDYDIVNTRLTNNFDNMYRTTGAGVKYRANLTGWNYTIGADVQKADLESLLQGKTAPIGQSFTNVLPNAQIQIGKNRYRNFRINYNGNTQNPSVTQLQPIDDISDPLNITRGNPNLKQAFVNNFRVNYSSFDPYTMKSFFLFVNARQSINAIVSNDSLFKNGGRLTTYGNANGVYNLNGNANIGLPLKIGAARANINLGSGVGYSRNINFISSQENEINTWTLSQRASFNYNHKELFDISAGGSVNFNNAKYSLQQQQNTNYMSYGANFENNWYLPKNLTIGTSLDYTANTGRAAGFNNNFTLWNAYISKNFLKNKKGELKLSVNDLLNQNTGISRTASGNYVEDTRYLVLKRYVKLTFTYNLNQFGNLGRGNSGQRMMMMNIQR